MIIITGFGKKNSLGSNIARKLKEMDPDIKIMGIVDQSIPEHEIEKGADIIYTVDLTNPSSWDDLDRFFCSIATGPGEIKGLINCAGMNHMDWINNISYDQYSAVMKVNLDAPIFLTKSVNQCMKDGFILNICSMGARKAFRTSMPYNVSKAGLVMATKQMARELYPETGNVIFGISPNQVEGSGMTLENEAVILKVRGWDKEKADQYRKSGMLVKEDTSIDQLSGFIAYLLSDRKNYIQFCGMEIQYGD